MAEEAKTLKECSTKADGVWMEVADKATYDELMGSAQALRALLFKPQRNPKR